MIPHPEQPFSGLDAEVRVGDEMGPGEAVVMRLNGELADHADAVVLPLLLPDTPVVTWWPAESPVDPAAAPLGKLAMRRITDASGTHQPASLAERLRGYSPATPTWPGPAARRGAPCWPRRWTSCRPR
ncbi:glucose-6-phosphate dehydrogenase assembly protein OpcA [Catenulispora yoronensis]